MTAMEILEGLETEKKESIRAEYEAMVKKSMKQGFNCENPENWLAQHPEIAPKLFCRTNWNPRPELLLKFKAIMIEAGFGDVIERARWFALGR
jgi:hypothetical protein